MTVTRFAPSPTGLLHLGNARAAILNALIARKTGGRLLLRFDDTDPGRARDSYVDAARADLRWLGLRFDQELRQRDRLSLYAQAADRLRAAGRLYPCYETGEELALRRRARLSSGRPPTYDRAALKLSAAERAALEAAGRRPHWRFLLQGPAAWDDAVLGPQRIEEGAVSDPVLIRADATPLYTLSSVVDDADCAVTDVVRGADHLTNTAVQIQIFAALDAAPPRFGHFSLLTAPGGAKLSKRDGARPLCDLRADGIEPEAVLSVLATLGSARDPQLFPSVDAAAEGFDLARFGAAPTALDMDVLRRLSAQRVRGMDFAEAAPRLAGLGISGDRAAPFWLAVRPNLDTLAGAAPWWRIATEGAEPAHAPEDEAYVREAMALLPARPWGPQTWKDWTGAVRAATGRKGAALFRPLRLALTGQPQGPDMAALMPLLTRDPV